MNPGFHVNPPLVEVRKTMEVRPSPLTGLMGKQPSPAFDRASANAYNTSPTATSDGMRKQVFPPSPGEYTGVFVTIWLVAAVNATARAGNTSIKKRGAVELT